MHAACNVKAPRPRELLHGVQVANLLFCRNLCTARFTRIDFDLWETLFPDLGKQLRFYEFFTTFFFFNPLVFYNKQGPGDSEHIWLLDQDAGVVEALIKILPLASAWTSKILTLLQGFSSSFFRNLQRVRLS